MKSEKEDKDWLNDYGLLKQVNPANPFNVPAGYFDDLGSRIASSVNLNELKTNGIDNGFIVPENYFEELTGKIEGRIFLADNLAVEETGFTIPDGYFDTLTVQVNSRLLVEEILSENEEPFAVPAGYFKQLNENILDKTVNAGKIDRKGIIVSLFRSTAVKYATAACFALVLGGTFLLNEFSNNSANEHKNSFLHKQLSNVPVDEIKNYLLLNEDAGDTQQTVATQATTVDDDKLKNALQDYVDSVQ